MKLKGFKKSDGSIAKIYTDPTLTESDSPADAASVKAKDDLLQQGITNNANYAAGLNTRLSELENGAPSIIAPKVTEWLEDNVNPVGSAVTVDSSLTVAGSAADAKKTGDEIGDLKSDLNDSYMPFDESLYVRGQIENGVDGTYYQDRIKFASIYTAEKDLYLKITSGYSVLFVFYDENDSYVSQVAYRQNDFVIAKDSRFRVVIRNDSHHDADHTTPADILQMSTVLRYETETLEKINYNAEGHFSFSYADIEMENGTINAYGQNDNGAYNFTRKMRSVDYVFLNKGDTLKVEDTLLRAMIFFYYNNKTFKGQTAWITNTYTMEESCWCRVQFSRINDAQLEDTTRLYYRSKVVIESDIMTIQSNVNDRLSALEGTAGQYTYTGTPIELNRKKYSISKLWDFVAPSTSGSFTKQASSYYGGVVFKLWNPNLVQLYNYSDGTKITEFAITSGHGDSIDFSQEFYNASDEFPLAYITADTNPATVYVNRITRTEATLIRTLTFPLDKTGYYGGHVLDNLNNVIYQIGYKNNDYQSSANGNEMIISKWDLSDLTLNEDTTYTPKFIESFNVPFMNTTQGQCMIDDKVFIMASNPYAGASGVDKTKIFVVEVGAKRISNVFTEFIEPIRDHEGEGVFFVPNGNTYSLIVDMYPSGLYQLTL